MTINKFGFKTALLVLVAFVSGAVVSFFAGRKVKPQQPLAHRACLQYEVATKWIGDCDIGDEGEACPEWAIEVMSEKPIAPCSAEL